MLIATPPSRPMPARPATDGPVALLSGAAGACVAALLLAVAAADFAVPLVLGGLAIWALRGPAHALQAMYLSVIVKFLNPGLVGFGVESGPLPWLVLTAAGLRVLPGLTRGDARLLAPLWAFAVVALLLSTLESAALGISVMKLVVFTWVTTTVVVATSALSGHAIRALATWFTTTLAVCAVLSAALLPFPEYGHLRSPTGFQGIFNHPQTLAVFVAPLVALLLADLALVAGRPRLVSIAMLVAAAAVLVGTEARTGVVAATLGLAVAIATRLWRGRRSAVQTGAGRIFAWLGGGGVAVLILALATGQVETAVQGFLLKRSGADDLATAFERSRGVGITQQWQSFLDRPLSGNGFGVYPRGTYPMEIVEFAGIPISAPVEKGFLPTAVLEETGILGAALFLWFVARLVRRAWRNDDLSWIAVFVTALAINVGEAILLSPGGPGLHAWCLLAVAALLPSAALPRAARAAPVDAVRMPATLRFPNLLR